MQAKPEHLMSVEQLKAKYDALVAHDGWSDHPDYTPDNWIYEVSEGNTRQGYWHWVASQIEQDRDEKSQQEICAPAIRVRTAKGVSGETHWHILPCLTDRAGLLNYTPVNDVALAKLERDSSFLDKLRFQMSGHTTYVAFKDGEFGILYEQAFHCLETDGVSKSGAPHKPYAEVVDSLLVDVELISKTFPGVHCGIPDKATIKGGRPALYAFVSDGLFEKTERLAFAAAWQAITEVEV